MRRGVFLDRDGVLVEAIVRNGRAYAPTRLEDFRLVPDASAQVERLRSAGLVCVVVTNQPEVSRGLLDPDVLQAMHAQLRESVPLHDVFVCPHDASEGCECRKPLPGMLYAAAERWALDLPESFIVGDRSGDIEAGRAAGCYTLLLDRPYSGKNRADLACAELSGAVDAILARVRET
jgi:D-glycero-D-manno-heptose 1,7-bisphosphate phosphatase